MTSNVKQLAAEWVNARQLYPLYVALAKEFVIETPQCADLEADLEAPGLEAVEAARLWFREMDDSIQVHQLRQFLQSSPLTDERMLENLLAYHLRKKLRSNSDRDKLDFLLVQYFSHRAPPRLEDAQLDLAYVSQALEPVLGPVDLEVPEWLQPLEGLLEQTRACHDLNELFTSRVLEEARQLKSSAGGSYLLPISLVAFARFNFVMRRTFFRLMHDDLNLILDGLRELESRAVVTLDCRKAQFSAEEPVERLRMICQSWKVMFHAEYSAGQPLCILVDLRTVVEAALSRTAFLPHPSVEHAGLKVRRAAAGAQAGSGPAADAPGEFAVNSTPAWDSGSADSDPAGGENS